MVASPGPDPVVAEDSGFESSGEFSLLIDVFLATVNSCFSRASACSILCFLKNCTKSSIVYVSDEENAGDAVDAGDAMVKMIKVSSWKTPAQVQLN